tara:strand:+ start:9314 stop:10336 length:1023 start_codon:yes stop_codon:yes gene_type:complete
MKILFLGLGGVGQRHLRNIDLLSKTENEYITFSKRKRKSLITNDLRELNNVDIFEKFNIKVKKNIQDAFLEKPDLTVISTPSSFHYEHAKYALNSNSNVFLEKPATISSNDCKDLIQIEKACKKKISVSFQMRFTPWIKKIKEIINSNKYGKIAYVTSIVSEYMPSWHKYEDYRESYASQKILGGGVTFTQIHEIDYLFYIFENLKFVHSISGKFSELEIDVEDTSISVLKSKKENYFFPINLIQDYLGSPKRRELIIQFTNAKLYCDLIKSSIIIYKDGIKEAQFDFKDFERNNAFLDQMQQFIDSLPNSKLKAPVSLDEALISIDLAEKIKLNGNSII